METLSDEPGPASNISDPKQPNSQNKAWDPGQIVDTIAESDIQEGRPIIRICQATTTAFLPENKDWVEIFFHLHNDQRERYQQLPTTRIMRKATTHRQPSIASYRVHLDGGANTSLTNDEQKLINYKNIKRHAIAGVADEGPENSTGKMFR